MPPYIRPTCSFGEWVRGVIDGFSSYLSLSNYNFIIVLLLIISLILCVISLLIVCNCVLNCGWFGGKQRLLRTMERACGCNEKKNDGYPKHVDFVNPENINVYPQPAPHSLPVSRTSSLKKASRSINKSNSFKYYGKYTSYEDAPTATAEDLNLQLRKLRMKKRMALRAAASPDYVNFRAEVKKDSETQTVVPLIVLKRRGRNVETMV